MESIDFVIPWVDGSDEQWQREFVRYKSEGEEFDSSMIRYRNWDNLRYWFRAVEKFAPWVRKIHFITWGHLPSWLDTSNPKLNIVRHGDYIPSDYLPTFSSHPIELNIHRIEGLSEHFVLFNDDTFLGCDVAPERFFKGGLPCDTARLGIIADSSIAHIILNDVNVINRRHRKSLSAKWFSPRYKLSDIMKTLSLAPWSSYAGFKDTHMPQPFLRSTFDKLWQQQAELLDATSRHRIRSNEDVNQYLMRYEQLVTGNFKPVSYADTHLDTLTDEGIDTTAKYIREKRYAMFCLNDSETIIDFEGIKAKLNAALDEILPYKCSYEL